MQLDDKSPDEVLDEWLKSDLVVRFVSQHPSFSKIVLKNVLRQKLLNDEAPFETMEQLLDAVKRASVNPILGYVDHHCCLNECILRTFNHSLQSSSESGCDSSEEEMTSSPTSGNMNGATSCGSSPGTSQFSLSQKSTGSSQGYVSSSEPERDSRFQCKVCLDREIGVVFLPCSHSVACTKCAPVLTKCPYCRAKIANSVRIFLP